MPIKHPDNKALVEKRKQLFSLWQDSEDAPEQSSTPVPQPSQPLRQPVQTAPAQRQSEEVQEMLRKFVNPNADQWSSF